jgi:DNA-directed RNA polymerase subunit RPC12/RpoP
MSETKNMQCKNCGAGIEFSPKDELLSCSFCGSKFIVEVQLSAEEQKQRDEGGIVLFKTDRDAAKTAFGKWISKGLFKPGDLVSSFLERGFEGVYIPFWRIHADAETEWSGRDRITIREASKDQPAEYEYRERHGNHHEHYKDFITASKGLAQAEIDPVMPFEDDGAKPWDPVFMDGFRVEKPSCSSDTAIAEASTRIKDKERRACDKMVGELLHVDTKISNTRSRLMMLPIWLLVYVYRNKAYRVVINGQTGKVGGKKPVSWIRVLLAILITAGIIIGLILLLSSNGK